jgi:hypothetical protein
MAILSTEKVLTLDYWKYAYKLQPGDYVFDRFGNLVEVKIVQEFRSNNCYEVLFDDYLKVSGNDKLIFPVEDKKTRERISEYKGVLEFKRQPKQKPLSEFVGTDLKFENGTAKHSIPACGDLKLPTQYLEIPPFVMGLWFISRIYNDNLTCSNEDLEFIKDKLASCGYKMTNISKYRQFKKRFKISPSVTAQLKPNVPTLIPMNYLMGSVEQRLELLSGIIYARLHGYNKKTERFNFTTKDLHLVKQIQFLAESLGAKTAFSFDEKHGFYRLNFKTHHQLVHHKEIKRVKINKNRRYIKQITELPEQNCVHIETTGEDGTFLVGEGLIPCR